MAKNLIIKKGPGMIKNLVIKKEIIMAKKIIVLALCAFFCSLSVKAQLPIDDKAFYLDRSYTINENMPIVRYHQGFNLIVSSYEKGFRSIFSLISNNNQVRHTVELPSKYYVYDFEILGNDLYFCGEIANSTLNTYAIIGRFDLQTFINNPGTVQMEIYSIPFQREHCRLNKMVAYYDNSNSPIVMAIGYGEDIDDVIGNINGIDFLAEIDFGLLIPNLSITSFPGERYHDILETARYITLIGADVTMNHTVGFRKLDKANLNSNIKDDFYFCNFPHPEPLTFIVGESFQSSDKIATATFATIDGIDGTIIRKYDTRGMVMYDSHFIPSIWGKTQPYELKHIYNTEKLLMVQSSTAGTETLIFHLDINHSEDYLTIYEYYHGWDFYSLDRFYQPACNPGYIAAGYSANYPVYLINNVDTTGGCTNKVPIIIENRNDYDLNRIYKPVVSNSNFVNPSYTSSSSIIVNFIVDCP